MNGGGSAWNVIAFRRGLDARTLPRIRIPGEPTRARSVLVSRLAEILRDQRTGRKVAAMFLDTAFGSPIYERLRALGFKKGAIETDEKMALDLASPGCGINRSNKLVLESKAEMQKRGLASPDDGDALALTFAQPVGPRVVEETDDEEEFSPRLPRYDHRVECATKNTLGGSPYGSYRAPANRHRLCDTLGPDEIDGIVPQGAEAASPSAATARRGGTATTEPDRSDRGQRGADLRPARLCTPAPPTASV